MLFCSLHSALAAVLFSLLSASHVAALSFHVLDNDFPDPCLTQQEDGFYAFATGSDGTNVPMAFSDDFNSWTYLGIDAMPGPLDNTDWIYAASPNVWAPDVIRRVSIFTSPYILSAGTEFADHSLSRMMERSSCTFQRKPMKQSIV